MSMPMSAEAVVDRYFLEMRAKVLEVAAAIDRVERAAGGAVAADDERMVKLRDAIATLNDGRPDRAARVQMIFSDPYVSDWPRPARPQT